MNHNASGVSGSSKTWRWYKLESRLEPEIHGKRRLKAGLQRRRGTPGGMSGSVSRMHGQQAARGTWPRARSSASEVTDHPGRHGRIGSLLRGRPDR